MWRWLVVLAACGTAPHTLTLQTAGDTFIVVLVCATPLLTTTRE
jgi:hypothetical protein